VLSSKFEAAAGEDAKLTRKSQPAKPILLERVRLTLPASFCRVRTEDAQLTAAEPTFKAALAGSICRVLWNASFQMPPARWLAVRVSGTRSLLRPALGERAPSACHAELIVDFGCI
jgi:hypothetical protein